MSNSDDFVSFEKALRNLKMRSEELKKLVSEGEIRAFRDGDSMKFRSEDVDALLSQSEGESELSFADSLEDDTGMVTEQLSDEDTLLADDDVVVEEAPRARRNGGGRSGRAAAAAPVAVGAPTSEPEPAWVTAIAVLGFVVMIWGCLVAYNISQESDPADSMLTSAFAAEKK
ncbi:MAG: hypothetical protein NXI31_24985 [bacterium]|nr:hypothetical protein [bacterium]